MNHLRLPLIQPPSTPTLPTRTAAVVARRKDYVSFLVLGGGASVLAAFLVAFAIILTAPGTDSTTQLKAMYAYQLVHFMVALLICLVGGGTLCLLLRKILASTDHSIRKPSWNAMACSFLLLIAGLFNIIGNAFQIIAAAPNIGWTSIAEDWFTIPETLVTAGLLSALELNPVAVHHYRRAKISILPACLGLSVGFLILNIVGVTTWNDTVQDVGLFKTLLQVCGQ